MEKTYIFTREIRKWGVEAGDIYSPPYHQIVGGTERLLKDGIIKVDTQENNMENQQKTEKIFVGGMYLNKVNEKAPAFVITNQSIHVEQAIKWLQDNRNLANQNGYINITGMESQQGKRYFQVDTFVPKGRGATETKGEYPEEDIDPENIPF